jgi:hypothetical protein
LAGDDGKRKKTPHAFPVFVRADLAYDSLTEDDFGKDESESRVLDYIKIGEPTYHWDTFEAGGPGSGHIISVRSLVGAYFVYGFRHRGQWQGAGGVAIVPQSKGSKRKFCNQSKRGT